MAKKILLILFVSSWLIGCADLSVRPFFREDYKIDCGNSKRMFSYELCHLDSFGY